MHNLEDVMKFLSLVSILFRFGTDNIHQMNLRDGVELETLCQERPTALVVFHLLLGCKYYGIVVWNTERWFVERFESSC
jgi:hypothetical protein